MTNFNASGNLDDENYVFTFTISSEDAAILEEFERREGMRTVHLESSLAGHYLGAGTHEHTHSQRGKGMD